MTKGITSNQQPVRGDGKTRGFSLVPFKEGKYEMTGRMDDLGEIYRIKVNGFIVQRANIRGSDNSWPGVRHLSKNNKAHFYKPTDNSISGNLHSVQKVVVFFLHFLK